MSLATTSLSAIIDQMITIIEALTPSGPSSAPSAKTEALFRRARIKRTRVGDQVPNSARFRQFDIFPPKGSKRRDVGVLDPGANQVERMLRVTVAYPNLPVLYGVEELDDLFALAEADAVVLRDAIFSPGNLVAGQLDSTVTQDSLDQRDPALWLLDLDVRVQYYATQTLT